MLIPLQYAVLIGVALAVLLFVINQSNKIVIKEWVYRPGKLPLEQEAPEQLESNKATILVPFGSLFFAAATAFEEQLPSVEEDTRNAAVILNLRGRTDLGSTFLGVLERYSELLQDHESRLMLAGVGDFTRDVIEVTGQARAYGRENIFMASEVVGASIREAYHVAEDWIGRHEDVDTNAETKLDDTDGEKGDSIE